MRKIALIVALGLATAASQALAKDPRPKRSAELPLAPAGLPIHPVEPKWLTLQWGLAILVEKSSCGPNAYQLVIGARHKGGHRGYRCVSKTEMQANVAPPDVKRRESAIPKPGTLQGWEKVLVDNNYCRNNLILLVTGAPSHDFPRGYQCVVRPEKS